MKTLALDLDGTLAATHDIAFDLMLGPDHGYTYEDIESWQWGLDEFGAARFLSAIWHSWTLRVDDIRPTEPNISEKVRRLNEGYTVDVVTANPDHMGIDDGKEYWLDKHGIEYRELIHVPPAQSKGQYFEYDVFVDDKPALPSRVGNGREVWLKAYPYNKNVEGEYKRFDSLDEIPLPEEHIHA